MALIFYILISTLVFTLLIILLVALLALVEKNVVKAGDCKIFINDDPQPILVPAGKSLLRTLANTKIFLPSACGGGGTCAMCKCQVLEGGGNVLPTETGQLSRREQKNHMRLSCQVKVRNDMKIRIPDEVFHIKLTARSAPTVMWRLYQRAGFRAAGGSGLNFKAGGYIQLDVPPYVTNFKDFDIEKQYHPDWDKFNLWDLKAKNDESIFRAYSMANHPGRKNCHAQHPYRYPAPNDMSLPPGKASSYALR